MAFAEQLKGVLVGLGLVLAGEVQVDVRHLGAAVAQEGLEGDVEPVLVHGCAAVGTGFVGQVCAAAVLLEPTTDGTGVLDAILHSDASGAQHLHMKAGGSAYPPTHDTVDKGWHYVYQEGQPVFKAAVSNMADTSVEIMERNHLTADDIRYLVPHQANLRIIDATAHRMGLPAEKCMINIDKFGNTTAATIPLCLWDYESRLRKGDNLILSAFGGGYTWGALYVKWAYNGGDFSK